MGEAIVLAGGKTCPQLARYAPYEACLPIGEKPMVYHVVSALLEAPSIKRVSVLGPADILGKLCLPEEVTIAEGAPTIEGTLARAVGLARTGSPFLLASADIPLLRASSVEYFWQSAERERADLAYPIVRREQIEDSYPYARRTYVRLTDGIFTGGNLLYVKGGASQSLLHFAKRIFAARKKPWRIASLFGIRFCLRFLLGRLSAKDIEQHLSEGWGRRCRALIVPHAEIAMDVDKLSDYHLINKYMNETTR
ncbi:MAG: nucleotidyltransferase family protein [Selenomonadales bacterium]|nr:nucleotidyltransferase family protein [Selenomonadales bacterium]